jgi:hypothetical protein
MSAPPLSIDNTESGAVVQLFITPAPWRHSGRLQHVSGVLNPSKGR